MQVGTRHLILASAMLLISACAANTSQVLEFRDERVGSCLDEKPCELAGTLTLQTEPGNVTTGSIDQVQGTCVPLLLPESLSADPKHWQGKQVRVIGTALARARGPIEVTRVKYRDRWLLDGICGSSDIVVYVDRIVRERQ